MANQYNKLKLELNSIHKYSQIEPQGPLEAHMLEGTDISEHLMTLYMLTKHFKLSTALELGVRGGKSTIALLSAAKEIGGIVTGIDIVDCSEAKAKVDSLGLSKWWCFIKGGGLEVEWNASIDHLFIDTAHTYEQTLKELQRFEPQVKNGGVTTLRYSGLPDVLQAIKDYLVGRDDL